ncbi:hypothetical protein [Metasolibacillus sp. FSL K6-0083]|uniref:HAAS signaling domain-containing protein n=1 Tax=Metasolibacillus sp. FSL K6-0083 TaxID=2921416 RepID=UPI0007917064|nr:hypothetical protein A0U40_04735 [[Bacillus] sp. KCTC 13219]
MKLIEAYVYEVTRRLPKKSRNDIALELTSTIEDMLPDNYSADDIKLALEKLGSPAHLAANYRDEARYLIGPSLYDSYVDTIKLILPWALLITLIVQVVQNILLLNEVQSILAILIKFVSFSIVDLIMVALHVLFWITITFVILERSGVRNLTVNEEWTVEELDKVQIIPDKKGISIGEILFEFGWFIIFTICYFTAGHFIGIHQTTDSGNLLFVMPIFQQQTLLAFAPFFLLAIALEIVLLLYKLKLRVWTMNMAIANLIIKLISVVIFIIIIRNTNLINAELAPYLANLMNIATIKIEQSLSYIVILTIITIIITTCIDIYKGFHKAKI